MSSSLVSLIIQLISGAAGSGLLTKIASQFNLGPIGNLITGAIGGVGGGNILGSLLGGGAAAATSGGDLGSILAQVVGGGVGGPIVTAIVALIRNALGGRKPA
jgi:hypothetical protein